MNSLRTNDTVLHFFHKTAFDELYREFVAPKSLNFLKKILILKRLKKQQKKFIKSHYPLYSFIRDLINVYGTLLIQKLNTNVKFC